MSDYWELLALCGVILVTNVGHIVMDWKDRKRDY